MSVAASDIKFYLTGGAANSDVNASLGGTTSSVEITTATLNNLFDNISAAEALSGDSPGNHRAIAVKNTHATDTLYSAKIWGGGTADGPTVYTVFQLALDSGTQSVADEDTSPSSPALSFAVHATESGVDPALSLGDIVAGAQKRIWVRRNVSAGAPALSGDNKTLTVKGQTT